MFFTLKNGEKIEVNAVGYTPRRLTNTCFRGIDCRQAGNFFRWPHFGAFINDPAVQVLILPILERLIEKAYVHTDHRIELEFKYDVGWDRVIELEDLCDEDFDACEERPLNKRSSAYFLPDDKIKAPRTSIITMVITMRHKNHWQFGVWDMYPGYDIGVVKGNMTDDHELVWLHWSNPGAEEGEEDFSECEKDAERLSA